MVKNIYILCICSIFLVSCAEIHFPFGPDSIPDLLSDKYYYKTYTTNLSIDELQMNLTSYSRRCGYSPRTLERTSNSEAMFISMNGHIFMFGAEIKEESDKTNIYLYSYADKEFPEYFMIALENGQCVNPSAITGISGNPVIMERMNKAQP